MSGFYNKSGERIANLKRDKKELEIQIRREKKASQDYLNNILKEAVDIRAEAAVLKAEAIEMKTRVEASLLEEQRRTSDKIRYERANAASLTKRQRDREAAVSTAKEGTLRVARALERNTWECKYSVVEEKLTRAHIEVLQEREMWEDLRESLLKEKALVEERYYSAKAASRRMMQVQLDKSIEVERILQRDIQELTEHTIGLEKDNKRLERERRKSRNAAKHWRNTAEKRLLKSQGLQSVGLESSKAIIDATKLLEAQDAVIEEYKKRLCERSPPSMAKKKVGGKRGGSGSWDKYVVQLVSELLVLGVPPNVIPGTIVMMYKSLLGETPSKVPSSSNVRECRGVICIVCETLTAMKLAKSPCWKQVFTDATTKRQQSFQTLIIGVGTDNGAIDPVVISSCTFIEENLPR